MGRSRVRLPILDPAPGAFDEALRRHGLRPLTRGAVTTLQVNVGKRCNQACTHCHVEAGPKRTEVMPRAVVDAVLALLAKSPGVTTLDLTGGAPELHPEFRLLVREARALGKRVIDRCNLTILSEPGQDGLAAFLASERVEVIASLPCYEAANVDGQRGRGVFELSLAGLRQLNVLGFGRAGSGLLLDLVYNPTGPSLPPQQARLEARYREELRTRYGIEFGRLLTLTNLPVKRFAEHLSRRGQLDGYRELLATSFNPATVEALMCRALLSVGWDGRLWDCDFHQQEELGVPRTIFELGSLDELREAEIPTAPHCFGCTAGAGSSCGGALS